MMDDLAVILVSYNGVGWLRPCLTSLRAHAGECSIDVVVVSNSDDGTDQLVAREFPWARLVRCENRGFAHANNRGLATCNARYLLFLNVDTEILAGTFAELVAALDDRPEVGLAGVRQLGRDGAVTPSMRRFPNAARALGEALGSERLPIHPSWSGERVLDRSLYDGEHRCDWTSGSFLVARKRVIDTIGPMDERFFLYSEEPDLCLRARRGGWAVHHLPVMTILHHGGSGRADPTLAAQDAYSRTQFARKHFSRGHRFAYQGALGVGYALRAVAPGPSRAASRAALRTLVGIADPPFGQRRDVREIALDTVAQG